MTNKISRKFYFREILLKKYAIIFNEAFLLLGELQKSYQDGNIFQQYILKQCYAKDGKEFLLPLYWL
jgi:hypothetical protein